MWWDLALGKTTLFMVKTLGHVINEETNTTNIENIIVDAHYNTPLYTTSEVCVVGCNIS